jgi:hypothetical protein
MNAVTAIILGKNLERHIRRCKNIAAAAGKVRVGADGKVRKAIGRPKVSAGIEKAIRAKLAAGVGILKTAADIGVGSGTVQRIKREAG